MKMELKFISALIILQSLVSFSDGRRCFSCKQASTPQGCGNITICSPDEYCFTEQFVSSTGNVVFNSGCHPKAVQCTVSRREVLTFGERLGYKTGNRKRDISICKECCSGDYCNMNGCGVQETPREQRGPYCYHCDRLQDPSSCRNVLLCSKDEVCVVYTKSYDLTGVTKSTCMRQSTCDIQLQQRQDQKCATNCCMEDFCNDQCGKAQNNSVTSSNIQMTTSPHTSTTNTIATLQGGTASIGHSTYNSSLYTTNVPYPNFTPYPTKTTSINVSTMPNATDGSTATVNIGNISTTSRDFLSTSVKGYTSTTTIANTPSPTTTHIIGLNCDTSGGYLDLIDSTTHTRLCVHIVASNLMWDHAENHCHQEGGTLVVLDTLDKSHLLRQHLIAHTSDIEYWIGAKDFKDNNSFTWITWHNKHPIESSQSDWYPNQPDHVINSQHEFCVALVKQDNLNLSFQWHDKKCRHAHGYICERRLTSAGIGHGRTSTPNPIATSDIPYSTTKRSFPPPTTSTKTTRITAATTHSHSTTSTINKMCDTEGGYIILADETTQTYLCVHLSEQTHARWHGAVKYCINEGGHLLILDTLEKSQLLRRYLIENSIVANYWIGAIDHTSGHHDFKWVNQHLVEKSEADWQIGEPNNTHQSCVLMDRHADPKQMYQWMDRTCHLNRSFICEKPLTTGGRAFSPMGISTSTKPITQTSTVGTTRTRSPELRCDTRGGYINLNSTDGHARLCVHIVGDQHVTWGEARKHCHAEHGEMVILDTLAKSRLLRRKLESLPHRYYWIGASYLRKHHGDRGYFQWVNHQHIDRSQTDWGHHEPQHIQNGDHEICVASNPRQSFLWYAEMCNEKMSYICERSLVPDGH